MKISGPHLSCDKLRRGAARRQAARWSAWLPQRQPSRCRCAPRLVVLPPSRQRLIVHAAAHQTDESDGDDSAPQHVCAGTPDNADPAVHHVSPSSMWLTGRQWLGRAACCALAAAVALTALPSADVGAAAAAATAATAAAQLELRPAPAAAAAAGVGGFRAIDVTLRARPTAEPVTSDSQLSSASLRSPTPPPPLLFSLDASGAARADGLAEPGPGPGLWRLQPAAPFLVGAGASGPAPAAVAVGVGGEVASETEDRLLEVARQVEARLEGVLGALAGGVPQMVAGESAQDASTSAAHSLIREVWEVVDNYYLDARATGFDKALWAELRDAALAVPYRDTAAGHRAVRDMMARGLSDPYCRFIGPSELEAMKKYDVSGVGLNLGTASEYVIKTGNELPATRDPAAGGGEGIFVVGVSKGSAADVAGVRQGDELLEIQGRSLADVTPFRAAGLISGATEEDGERAAAADAGAADRSADSAPSASGSGSGGVGQRRGVPPSEDVVQIKVRHNSGEEQALSLTRPRRTLPSAVTTSLTRSPVPLPLPVPGGGRGEERVGTVRLTSFNARAQADVAAAIRQLEAAGATRLVLDLRDNRGGLVTEGLEVARLFLEGDAPIVITERRDAPPDTPRAPGPPLTSAPLLVLVNGHTASASEIVAGALHDNCRAVLAGSRTYGKGLIQSVYELSDGSGLVITVGKYLTPRGTDIDRYGIKPDFNGVPSAAQYDSTVKACKLSGLALAAAPAPPVYGDADKSPPPAGGLGTVGGWGASIARGGWGSFSGWWR